MEFGYENLAYDKKSSKWKRQVSIMVANVSIMVANVGANISSTVMIKSLQIKRGHTQNFEIRHYAIKLVLKYPNE